MKAAPASAPNDVKEILEDDVETAPSDTATIFPKGGRVVIEDQVYPVRQFTFGKTLRMLALLSDLADRTDVSSLLQVASKGENSFLAALLAKLPDLLSEGRMPLLRVLALTIMPDALLKKLDLEGGDFDTELKAYVGVVYDADMDKVSEILSLGIESMGIDSIRKNFPMLLKKMGSI